MFVANMIMPVRVNVEINNSDDMIEKLDEMLTAYGVQHFFSERNPKDDDDDEIILDLFYEEEDNITVDLVYMLWAKVVKKVSDEKILKAMKKVAA